MDNPKRFYRAKRLLLLLLPLLM